MRNYRENPLVVIWEVTQSCGLACAHCRAEAKPGRHPGELTTEEGFKLIDGIAEMEKPLLVLTGGDPMERDDLEELVRHAVSRGLKTAVSPSATGKVTYGRLKALKEAGLHRAAVSLDSHDPAVHDKFRGVAGSHKRTLEIIRDLRKLKIPLQIGTTITRFNHWDLEEMAAEVEKLGALLWSVFFLVPTGRASREMMISAERAEAVLRELYAISRRVRFAIKTTEAPHYRRIRAEGSGLDMSRIEGIADAKGFMFVSHLGEVFPSGFLPLSAGNVRKTAPLEIYRYSSLFCRLRDPEMLKGKCRSCRHRRLCGGSRARAYALTGDPLASDPLCAFPAETAANP